MFSRILPILKFRNQLTAPSFMKTTILLCLLTFGWAKGQDFTTLERLDSIVLEADKIYRFEKVAWSSGDLVRLIPSIKDSLAGNIVYEVGDTLVCGFLNLTQNKVLVQYDYLKSDLSEPISIDQTARPVTMAENKLIIAKNLMVEQAIEQSKIDFFIPDGNYLNLILFPIEKGYRMYILSGTYKSDIIPFGNDAVLEANKSYQMTKAIQFHSRAINMQTKINGMKTTQLSHSHGAENPYIPATDICTFKLYAPLYSMKEFSVYIKSGKTLTYNLETNQITVENE